MHLSDGVGGGGDQRNIEIKIRRGEAGRRKERSEMVAFEKKKKLGAAKLSCSRRAPIRSSNASNRLGQISFYSYVYTFSSTAPHGTASTHSLHSGSVG